MPGSVKDSEENGAAPAQGKRARISNVFRRCLPCLHPKTADDDEREAQPREGDVPAEPVAEKKLYSEVVAEGL
ncbi:hypothetical protein QR680_015091 [Steinernema hermaphroditum]|nr:hypothetical protein QR680_015091 [Steinernema hermaphroditum]